MDVTRAGRPPRRVPTGPRPRAWRSLLAASALVACASAPGAPLRLAPDVDLDRYLGRWYEVASFPQRFQEGCVATTATYSRRDDGRLRVVNECRDGSVDGRVRSIEGVAWVSDPERSNARLKVQFFWPFRGNYWILAVDADYKYALVGQPSRDALWILSRTPQLPEATLDRLLGLAEQQGFDPTRLRRTPQS